MGAESGCLTLRDGENHGTRPRMQRAAARGRHQGPAGGPTARRGGEAYETPFPYVIHRKTRCNGRLPRSQLLPEVEAGHDKMARRDLARWIQRRILTLKRLKRISVVQT